MKKIIITDTLVKFLRRERPLKFREDIGIYTTRSNADALGILDGEKASLIIADYDLDANEIERLCEGIRRGNGRGKVSILFMGSDDTMDSLRTTCGAYQYLSKSAPPDKLFGKVLQMLGISWKKEMRSQIKVAVKGSFMNEYFICNTLNISPGGLMIETAKVLEKGSVITCSFSPGNSGPVAVDCKVIRVEITDKRMKRYGLRFENLGALEKKVIEDYIASEHAGVCA